MSNKGPFFVEVFYRHRTEQTINEFKKEHVELLEAFASIKKHGIESRDGMREFWKTENMLTNHLNNEDTNMYPSLRRAAKSDNGLKAILTHFSNEMANIIETIGQLSSGLASDKKDINFAEMNDALDSLSDLLVRRIKLEEAVIYPAFINLEDRKAAS
jgi:iron-sulfur cluster repair protein YtfE (RIC family)